MSNTGYFIYCNGNTDKEAFDARLEFDITLIDYVGDDSWVEKTVFDIKKLLDGEKVPPAGAACDYCAYFGAREEHLRS